MIRSSTSLSLFLLLISATALSQKITINGYISDQATGERLINANVYDAKTMQGSISNTYGFFSLTLPSGDINLMASFLGYEPQKIKFSLQKDTTINFYLKVKTDELKQITVYGSGGIQNKIESSQMSTVELSSQKIKNIPVILGEADVLKAIQLLPGVQSGTDGTSSIYVRGGGSDQNLFLLDGVPIYNAGHLLGFFSVFNPDAIKTVKLYKGGFPARFGGRLSSVVDVTMKDGNMKEIKGDFSIGLIASKLMLEGPITKDKTSFMISARRTYLDILAKPLLMAEDTKGGAFFHDYNLKINHIFSNRSRLYFSSYFGKDKAFLKEDYNYTDCTDNEDFDLSWGNIISSIRWNYMINNRLFSNTTLTYSHYQFNICKDDTYYEYDENNNVNFKDINYYNYKSGIRDLAAKIDFDYFPSPTHSIKFGGDYTCHYFTPGATHKKSDYGDSSTSEIDTTYGNNNIYAHEWSAYIEDDFTVGEKLKINAGIHFSLFNVESTNYFRTQPRLSIRYKASDTWSLKASYSRMAQHVHLLTTSGISLPTDLWVPITKDSDPPISDQVALGTAINLPHNLTLTIEGFYKNMQNLIEYKDGASFSGSSESWEDKVEQGKGWSYGGEFLLEKTVGKTTGWLGYTLAWNNRKFDNINNGKVFPAKYDRRHDISLVMNHKFSDKFDIGATWVYGTGNAVTMAYSEYQLANIQGYTNSENIDNYKSRNNYRMPATHHLDIGINFHKQKKKGIRTWNISVYNVYNRQNPFYMYWDSKETETKLKQVCILPIIPSVSYSYKF
jgi:hypothetical protein